jgi:hypothetical protein
MKENKNLLPAIIITLVFIPVFGFCQVTSQDGKILSGIMAQEYSKDISEFRAKEYIIKNILDPSDSIAEFEVNSITASKSGELSVVIYRCKEQQGKEGMLFCFWNQRVNEFNVEFNGYSFRNFYLNDAAKLLKYIEIIINNDCNNIINNTSNSDEVKNLVVRYDDLIFNFYREYLSGEISIRIFWDEFDSIWNKSNFKTTKRRFEKFFGL